MTFPARNTLLRQAFVVFAIAALLVSTGSQLASAKPAKQDTEKDLDKAMCDMMGGDWWEDGSDYTCYFDDWYLVCEDDGNHCQIFCDLGQRCERIIDDSRHETSLADDQKIVEPAVTPTPNPRGRGRSTTADQPAVIAPTSTPTPEPAKPEAPMKAPDSVVIDPA